MTRRAGIAAFTAVTIVVVLLTIRLNLRAGDRVAVAWPSWVFSVLSCYAGLALIVWWAVDRDRRG